MKLEISNITMRYQLMIKLYSVVFLVGKWGVIGRAQLISNFCSFVPEIFQVELLFVKFENFGGYGSKKGVFRGVKLILDTYQLYYQKELRFLHLFIIKQDK